MLFYQMKQLNDIIMHRKDYILDILRTLYPSLRMKLKRENLSVTDLDKRVLVFLVSLQEESVQLEFELYIFSDEMFVTSLSPYKGILVCGSAISCPQEPIANGYLDPQGYLTEKGSYCFFKILRDALSLYKIISERPNRILELYAVCFDLMHEQDSSLRFGHVNLQVDTDFTRALSRLIFSQYGIDVERSLDIFYSFQNIVMNHPDIFEGELN